MGPKERSGGSVVKRVMRGNCSKERRVILSISKACCGASGAKSRDRRYENVREEAEDSRKFDDRLDFASKD